MKNDLLVSDVTTLQSFSCSATHVHATWDLTQKCDSISHCKTRDSIYSSKQSLILVCHSKSRVLSQTGMYVCCETVSHHSTPQRCCGTRVRAQQMPVTMCHLKPQTHQAKFTDCGGPRLLMSSVV